MSNENETEIVETIEENKHLMTLLDAAAQYIFNADGCTRELFMKAAGGAYSAREQQMIIHVNSLMKNGTRQ